MSTFKPLGPELTEADHRFLAPLYNQMYGEDSPYQANGSGALNLAHEHRLLNWGVYKWIRGVECVIQGEMDDSDYTDYLTRRTTVERIRKLAPPDLRARIDFWLIPTDLRFERATRKTYRQTAGGNVPIKLTKKETWFQWRYPKVRKPAGRHHNAEELALLAKVQASADKAASPPWLPIRPESYNDAMIAWERQNIAPSPIDADTSESHR